MNYLSILSRIMMLMLFALTSTTSLAQESVQGWTPKNYMVDIFNVGITSSIQPSNTNNVALFGEPFFSIKRNEVQLIDSKNKEFDASVLFVLENNYGEKRLYILDAVHQTILSVAKLKLIKETNNEYYLFNAEYDNLMGHKNWVGKISFYEPSNNPFNTPQGSIIMEAGPGIKLELAGPINYSGSNKSLSTLLK